MLRAGRRCSLAVLERSNCEPLQLDRSRTSSAACNLGSADDREIWRDTEYQSVLFGVIERLQAPTTPNLRPPNLHGPDDVTVISLRRSITKSTVHYKSVSANVI